MIERSVEVTDGFSKSLFVDENEMRRSSMTALATVKIGSRIGVGFLLYMEIVPASSEYGSDN